MHSSILRSLFTTALFTTALFAVSVSTSAAPQTIDDCEKIQAADAYNQCLAIFGPAARGRIATHENDEVSGQDAELTDSNPSVTESTSSHSRHGGRTFRHAIRHGGTHRRHFAIDHRSKHAHVHRIVTVTSRHGKRTAIIFTIGRRA